METVRKNEAKELPATKADIKELRDELLEAIHQALDKSQSNKKWLKSSEVKKLLGISTGTLQNLRITGKLNHSKVGGIYFYDVEQIEKMIQDGTAR
ncbi:MAG: helix-turn-helix domain-containing protein [Cyclobacteriaceae bacterium]|nr:helix-turn-helix domain-containing protein [Cyclobacteriaceae bacterium]